MTIRDMQEALYFAFAKVYKKDRDGRVYAGRPPCGRSPSSLRMKLIYPAALPYGFTVSERFPWGGITVKLQVEGGIIRAAKIFTDAMEASLFTRIEQALPGSPYLISAINSRFSQKLEMLTDTTLLQMAGDVCALICGKMKAIDRGHES